MKNMTPVAPSGGATLVLANASWRSDASLRADAPVASVCRQSLSVLGRSFVATLADERSASAVVAPLAAEAGSAVAAPVAVMPEARQLLAVAAVAGVDAVRTAAVAKKQAHTYARPRTNGSRAWSPPV